MPHTTTPLLEFLVLCNRTQPFHWRAAAGMHFFPVIAGAKR
jgi:hypothetical protein